MSCAYPPSLAELSAGLLHGQPVQPVVPAPPVPADPDPDPDPGDGLAGQPGDELVGRKILLVEDEFVIALDFQIVLYRFGCDVLGPVGSVAEALVILSHERPDAAVLDINLRDGVVTPVAERLAAMGVPFVFVTARGARSFADAVLRCAPALGKPVDELQLRACLEQLLGGT